MLYKVRSFLILLFALTQTAYGDHPSILYPKGIIAFEEKKILFDTTAVMSMVVLTVIIMSFIFIYHYRATNTKAEYKPEWSHSFFLEAIWWGIPCFIVLILAIMTWIGTHKLDPFRRLNYPGEVMNVKVIALPWRWLFIYPDYNIAAINQLVLPVNKQVELYITCDNVPMSAFFVPQLGSQIYAMAGMRTRLHLIPTHITKIKGMNTQYNGIGFSGMNFDVEITSDEDFVKWTEDIKLSDQKLSQTSYVNVRMPTTNNKPEFFSGVEQELFDNIIHSYMSYEKSEPGYRGKSNDH